MIFSKKAFIAAMILVTMVPASTCSEQPMPQPSFKQLYAISVSCMLPGPFILARSTKNLFFAKRLEELVMQPSLTESIQKEALLLRKRGLRGTLLGTVLSLPIVLTTYKVYHADQEVMLEAKEAIAKS